ncbi:S8 family serine peptidase [Paenibacillus alkaliterrae]|uniref:S8 family serine peptidase n=1 Tax=Paenibacillus alkaliterrae TaxID=320909 RepID=UPI001F3A35D2|nr:S8 family serine peptidase [Paenibacillus alkaliterrae]MCF2937695.1 S8 family serine peptidase [Paenibacillus alkaliterrae]
MRYIWRTKIMVAVMLCFTMVLLLFGPFNMLSFALEYAGVREPKSNKMEPNFSKEERYIIKYKNVAKGKQDLKKKNKKAGKEFKHVPYITAELTTTELEDLRKDKNIEFIEKDHPIEVMTEITEQSEQDLYTDNIKSVGAFQAHNQGFYGEGIKVALLDTGIDKESPELRIAGGVSFVPEESDYDDYNGHGTAVSGIVSAIQDNKGLIGVAPNVDLYAVKVLNTEGIGTYSQVIQGIDWAIDQRMNVISMSFGGKADSLALQQAIAAADSQGLLIVAAAGNEGSGEETELYPARYSEVLSVGAVNEGNQRASFSSTGSQLDLVAPGAIILTTGLNGESVIQSGTSMAAPHVTGAAAALWASDHALTNQDVKQKLLEAATSLGEPNEYGRGLVNLAKALELSEEPPVIPILHKSEMEVFDAEVTAMSKKLMSLSDHAIQMKNIPLAKQIDNDYNSLIITNNELYSEPEIPESKDEVVQSRVLNDYYSKHITEFEKLKTVYQEAIAQYTEQLPTYIEPETDSLSVQSMQLLLNTPVDVSLATGAYEVFSFTPATSRGYKIYTGPYGGAGGSNDTVLELYSDANLTTLITSNDDSNGTLFSEIKPTLTANTTYYVKLRHFSSGAVHARLTAEVFTPAISLNSPIDVDLPTSGSQIFKFTPSSSGYYKIYTTYYNGNSSSGSNDTVLHVYSDVNLSTQIAYNDDSNGTLFSQVKMNMTAGKSFYIKLRGYGNGSVHARINVVPEPQSFQSIDLNTPIDVNVGQNQYMAYSFTPTITGSYRIYTGPYGGTGGSSDTILYLYGDTNMTSSLIYNDDSNGTVFSEINYTLSAGTTYYIRLTGFAGRSISTRIMISQPKNSYVYDDAGRLDYITLSTGGTLDYQYDANGNLKKKVFLP